LGPTKSKQGTPANENMVENLGASAPDFKKIEKRHLDVSKKVEIITSRRPMGQAIA
jgi:tetrahydromethanopterin S-methyltransferase subunit G